MDIYFVFARDPPEGWLDAPDIKVVKPEELGPLEGTIVVVVGDCQLAERLQVACMSEEEAERFLEGLKAYPPPGR